VTRITTGLAGLAVETLVVIELLHPGTKLMIGRMVGNYKVFELIGEGGMGAVYQGIDIMLEREVAIKMLRPELARDPNLVERFRSEAITLARLNHPNIATLYSFLRERDDFFMVMEFVRGVTLDEKIRREGAMPVAHAAHLFCQALEGIDHAHQMGIVHRDIKPANMMLTGNGSMKVMDFGIARVLGTSRMTRTGHLIGTVEYMSPEQVRGEETDARSDIYSLGMLLYEMLTGRLPFNATSDYELMRSQIEEAPRPPTQFAPHIPIEVERAIMRALAKRTDARFQTAGQFRSALLQSSGAADAQVRGAVPPPPTRLENPATPRAGSSPTQVTQRLPASHGSGSPGVAGNPGAAPGPKETRLASAGQNPSTALTPGGLANPQPHRNPAIASGYQPQAHQPPAGYAGIPAAVVSGSPSAGAWVGHQPGTMPSGGYPLPQSAQSAGAARSFLDALNWKHYAGAAAVLLVLIMVPVAMLLGGSKPMPASPAQTAPVPPPAAQPATPPTAEAPIIDPSAPTLPIPSESSASNPSRSGRRGPTPRPEVSGSRPGQHENPERAATAAPSDSSARPPAREAAPPSSEQRSTSGSANGSEPKKKDPAEKVGSKVGGAFKKLGGIFGGKKKKDEDKEKR
jgi:serine/threonine-protein kinase